MRSVNTFTYKKLMPIFALMISKQALAEEGDSPFLDPFKDHLYGGEGAELAGLANGN